MPNLIAIRNIIKSRSRLFWFLFVLFLFSFSCGDALAFTYSSDWGDVDVTPYVRVQETYDDNITYADSGKKDDFITTVAVGAQGAYEGKTTSAKLQALVKQDVYINESDFNNLSQDLRFELKKEFNKAGTFSVEDQLTHSEVPQTFEDEFGRQTGRYQYFRNRARLGYLKELNKQWQLKIRYDNEASVRSSGLSDSYENAIAVQTDYAYDSATIFSILYAFKHRQFDSGDFAMVYSAAAGLRRYLTERLYIEGRVGLDVLRSYDGDAKVRPNFKATIAGELTDQTTASITYERKDDATGNREELFRSWKVSGKIQHQATDRLRGNVTGFVGDGEYDITGVDDTFFGVSTGLEYDIRENIKANLTYTLSANDSSNGNRDYVKNTVMLGGELGF